MAHPYRAGRDSLIAEPPYGHDAYEVVAVHPPETAARHAQSVPTAFWMHLAFKLAFLIMAITLLILGVTQNA